MIKILSVFFCLITALFILPAQAHTETTVVKVGVLAKRGIEKALQRWEPTAEYLTRTVPGYQFRIIPMSFDEIPFLVSNNLLDFVIVNSAIYVNLSKRFGVSRIATLKFRSPMGNYLSEFGSVIFTHRTRNNLNKLTDLKNQSVAAVHKTSFGGWIMAAHEIRHAKIQESDLARLSFLDTHDAVVYGVERKQYDIGVVRTATIEKMDREGKVDKNNFHIINPQAYENFPFAVSTALYPEWPISKLSHVSRKLAKETALALMQMSSESNAAKAANIEGWTIPANYQSVEEILKDLNLPPFENYGKVTLAGVWKTYGYWLLLLLLILGALIFLWSRSLLLNRDLQRQQQQLTSNEKMFKGTFEQAAVGLLHVTLNGDFLRFNHKICTMTGYSAMEFSGVNLNELIYYKDLPKSLAGIDSLKNGNTSQFSLQLRIVHRDNHPIWAKLTVSTIQDEKGGINYLIMAIDDLSDTKALERKIAKEQYIKAAIFDMAGDGILGLDKEATHTFINPAAARLLGYSVEEMIGKDSHAMWHHTKEDGSPYLGQDCPITTVLKQGVVHRGENELVWCKNGNKFYIDFVSTPILEDEKIIGAVVVFREHSRGNE